jgi:CHAT domain-containing protein/tetratricopeptide (TPR) repeat protein
LNLRGARTRSAPATPYISITCHIDAYIMIKLQLSKLSNLYKILINKSLISKILFIKILTSKKLPIILSIVLGFFCSLTLSSTPSFPSFASSVQRGQILYQTGQYLKAIEVWNITASSFQTQGNVVKQALVLSYLALCYQETGQTQQATQVMDKALSIINKSPQKFTFAQILNNQGELLFNQGKLDIAFQTWQKSESLYKELRDKTGQIGTQINQARSLQGLGFYVRARSTLEKVKESFSKQPNSELKLGGLLNLGNVYRVMGDFTQAQKMFDQSLAIATSQHFIYSKQQTLFNLGNLAYDQQKLPMALKYYEQVTQYNSPVKLSALIHQLEILIELNKNKDASKVLPKIITELNALSASKITIYAQINLAISLLKMPGSDITNIAKLLAKSSKQALDYGLPRAESYSLGTLGNLYEQKQQWKEAKSLTIEALNIAQKINASDIYYQWQWQLGRIFKSTGDISTATSYYDASVKTLQSLRQDLTAINQDIQYSFLEKVEPVYREFVNLLLQKNPKATAQQQQKNISLARETIEALQLAELTNYFRQYCVTSQTLPIEKIDPTAAVIYPIILEDRIEVILSLPNQPLRHYQTYLPSAKIETVISQMRQSLRRTSFLQERLIPSQEIYSWLIKPAAEDVTRLGIKTLVFVLDGSLRNIPMAALYDGEKYLIEKYKIAIAPSIQLSKPLSLKNRAFKGLVAGLSKGNEKFSDLPGVKEEVEKIRNQVKSTTLLDEDFTVSSLKTQINTLPFSILHIATHGQFSSKPDDTFILAWDGRINMKELSVLLSNREILNLPPIELLVLSACQTAQGDRRATLGLAGIAVQSGVRSTLASLWTVNDESTANLMVKFYEELLMPDISKAEALQRAQINLIKSDDYNHPYFWAAFSLVGSWL